MIFFYNPYMQTHKKGYSRHINRVLDHIEKNLHRGISLDELAAVAHFSRFHFIRIFKDFLGETPARFILRLRMEAAAIRLFAEPDTPIATIATAFHFATPAAFSKSFRKVHGVSPSQCRKGEGKIGQAVSKRRQQYSTYRVASSPNPVHIDYNKSIWRFSMIDTENVTVEVQDMEEICLAYIRHVGPYAGDAKLFKGLFDKLFTWAGPRGFLASDGVKVVTVYHDDCTVTDQSKLRISIGLSIPPETEVSGEIGKMTLPAGKYALASFHITDPTTDYAAAWQFVYGHWLEQSGYEADFERMCYEWYVGPPAEDGSQDIKVVIPVKIAG